MTDAQQMAQAQQNPSLPGLEPRQYSESHYRFLAALIEAKSAHRLFEEIGARNYSAQTILAFHRVILSQFDKNAILAYNPSILRRVLDCRIALNLMVVECHESDTQMASFLNDQEAIKVMFEDFVSRSQNARERDQLLRTEFSTISNAPQQKEEAGILPFRK